MHSDVSLDVYEVSKHSFFGFQKCNLYMMLAWTWLMSRWSVGVWTTNFWILMHMVHFVRDQSFQSFFVLFFWGALIVKLVFFNQWLLSKIDVNIFAVAFVYLSSVIAMIIMIIILHECIYKYFHKPICMNSTLLFSLKGSQKQNTSPLPLLLFYQDHGI